MEPTSLLLKATFAGFIVGVLFKTINLPIPAPPVLSGILGIVGVYLGSVFYDWVVKFF
ncbi:XapX domain-containing protein [Persicirhabdus sediminis]|uniref:DUF1427 family protein n=1 Tax=Persicirhabdus sediminis TaxID=454144 RepID=A0A8J7MDE7_9BACT|nr:DUF1427 family protein [Persicirhabdus sediminis]MBK1790898.1 DUF1427 family protein [Persicirhabdus sediminis]